MAVYRLKPNELRRSIDPQALGFSDTSELTGKALPWIGQERAEKAARFGLSLTQSGYNLFVLGDAGSGRSSLMKNLLLDEAKKRPSAPDLCFYHNFDAPERPLYLWLDSGKGRDLKQAMDCFVETLQKEIQRELSSQSFKLAGDRILKKYKQKESAAYRKLSRFAQEHRFALKREEGRLVFTVLDDKGQVMLEEDVLALPVEKRMELDRAEEMLRREIHDFLEAMRPEEKEMNDAREALRMDAAKPVIMREAEGLRARMEGRMREPEKFASHVEKLIARLLDNLYLFEEDADKEEREEWFSHCEINVLVDNYGADGAPALIEDNPQIHTLFGSIDYQVENDVLVSDFTRIRAGSLFRANGGFLMLHVDDLLRESWIWEKLRRFLRSGLAHIEEPGTAQSSISSVSIEPEPVPLQVRIVLIGSRDQYYELEEIDPDFMRHFRVKVDFAQSIPGNAQTHLATSILISNVVEAHGLPHFSNDAVALLLEDAHRRMSDQDVQSAQFVHLEMLVLESAAICKGGSRVEAVHVREALAARRERHNYPEEMLLDSVKRGELLICVRGKRIGQINGLTRIDMGDYSFGFPVRVSANTISGKDGVLNIEREVELSGPNHDKGVFILESYLGSLFFHIAPLNLNASLVFEQEYSGVEGDSASLAELFALLSSLSGRSLMQAIAVTGAIDLHGEVMPVGGINEKIEGFFSICQLGGLDGTQGVIIPSRNRRHLMLSPHVIEAVERGEFHIYAIEQALEGMALLTGLPTGDLKPSGHYSTDTILGLAEKSLLDYRRYFLAARGARNP
ncbi:MAG: AAA family ATPase [Burkholderiales bacterium]|nr:AAA family ATPase [Burkholderiales bacterium]